MLYDAFRYGVQGLAMLSSSDDDSIAFAACNRLIDLYTDPPLRISDDDDPLFPVGDGAFSDIIDAYDGAVACPLCDGPDFDEEVLTPEGIFLADRDGSIHSRIYVFSHVNGEPQ